jgi:plastocyanin
VVTIVGVLAKPNPKLAIAATPVVATVHITSQGFQPATLVVKPGTRVIWTSDDSQATHLVASNPYPADNTLPSLKSAQLGNGAQFSYTFNHTGSYSYHDDLNPTTNGTIKVQ